MGQGTLFLELDRQALLNVHALHQAHRHERAQWQWSSHASKMWRHDWICPDAAVRAVPARLLLLCLLVRGSWLTVEDDRHVGAVGLLHRRGGRPVVAVSVGVAIAFQSSSVQPYYVDRDRRK